MLEIAGVATGEDDLVRRAPEGGALLHWTGRKADNDCPVTALRTQAFVALSQSNGGRGRAAWPDNFRWSLQTLRSIYRRIPGLASFICRDVIAGGDGGR